MSHRQLDREQVLRPLRRALAGELVPTPHSLMIVEERLRKQRAEGVRMLAGMPLDELALVS
jgi:hypothetical protein